MADADDLAAALRALHEEIDEELRARWDRSLPFQDGLVDRWERARRLGFGIDSSICSISAGVHIYTHDTVHWSLSFGVAERTVAPVTIGDGCHLGAQSVIIAGVTIGDQCVVGANSLVNRAVPDCTVVVGSPARPVGRVEGEGVDVRIVIDAPRP